MPLGKRPNEMPDWHLAQLLQNDCWWLLYAYLSMKAARSIHFRRTQLYRGGAEPLIEHASSALPLTALVLAVVRPDWHMHPATKGTKWPKSMQKTGPRSCMS